MRSVAGERECGKTGGGRLTSSDLVDNGLVRSQEVRGVVDELAALAVARQHDLGVRALCACLFSGSADVFSCPRAAPRSGKSYPSGEVRHKLAPRGVTTRQEAEDIGSVGHTLDSHCSIQSQPSKHQGSSFLQI